MQIVIWLLCFHSVTLYEAIIRPTLNALRQNFSKQNSIFLQFSISFPDFRSRLFSAIFVPKTNEQITANLIFIVECNLNRFTLTFVSQVISYKHHWWCWIVLSSWNSKWFLKLWSVLCTLNPITLIWALLPYFVVLNRLLSRKFWKIINYKSLASVSCFTFWKSRK